uniref:Uncharacterized protein n=1 Tax=Encephalitozoon cuniculi TaxID=6035 RepID=M1K5N8_ENCCN|nr:hypothetical protein ECU09_1720 [Encephalitozoon cuniculi]
MLCGFLFVFSEPIEMRVSFPVFTLQAKAGFVIVGGGGGEKEFGKTNGIKVLDALCSKELAHYSTDDIIVDIGVFSSEDEFPQVGEDDMSWDEYDEENPDSLHGGSTSADGPHHKDSSSNDKNAKDVAETKDRHPTLYLAASGERSFYLLRLCDNDLALIKKVDKKVSSQLFVKDLYAVSDKKLYGFHDVVSSPNSLDDLLKPERRRKKANGSLLSDESYEEYTYRPFRKDRRIVFKREEGRSDIVGNWERFFVTTGLVHKVVHEGERYNFVYNSKKYSYEKEIGGIVYTNGMLVYYLKGKDSVLYFQGEHERVYNIPKITAMSCEGRYTVVGTASGHAYLFDKCALSGKRKVYDVPITAVGFMNGQVYFSSLDGFVGVQRVSRGYIAPCLVLSIIIFILAVLISAISRSTGLSFLGK